MAKLEEIQALIYNLDKDERARLREWFDEFDGDLWDTEIEQDVKDEKLKNQTTNVKQQVNEGKGKEI